MRIFALYHCIRLVTGLSYKRMDTGLKFTQPRTKVRSVPESLNVF